MKKKCTKHLISKEHCFAFEMEMNISLCMLYTVLTFGGGVILCIEFLRRKCGNFLFLHFLFLNEKYIEQL